MTTEQAQLAPIPASFDNPELWSELAQQVERLSGAPITVTPELVSRFLASAVPLLFAADQARNLAALRGTVADLVIAQCQRHAGCLGGAQPVSATVHLVAVHMEGDHPVLRTHVAIELLDVDGERTVTRQFWDLALGAEVTVGAGQCPNCGAPVDAGALICGHCGTDVRSVVSAPLVATRLELY